MVNTYIALIRAINVGGHRKILMTDLREMFSEMGYKNVRSYIQSGNVLFNSDINATETLSLNIENQIQVTFGFNVSVIVRSVDEMKSLVQNNPFHGKDVAPFMLYVTFFSKKPSDEKQQELIELSSNFEMYDFRNGELFSLINKKSGQKQNFSNNYVEKITGIAGTTRNWNSINKILKLAKENLVN